MNISNAAYQQLLREYDEKQLTAIRGARFRTQKIEIEIPEIFELNSQIAEASASLAVMRVRGDNSGRSEQEKKRQMLINRRNELLKEKGYSLEYMEPWYECSECKDTGYINGEKCSCLKSRIAEILFDQSNIKEVLKKENFNTYTLKYYKNVPLNPNTSETPLSIAKKAAEIAWDFVQNFDTTNDNIFISGDTGTGKTFLSNCIAAELIERGFNVIYLSAVKLFGILADNTFGGSRNQDSAPMDLLSCDLLIIDDLGTEYTNAFIQSAFFNCINERLLRGKHTIISTNLSVENVRDNYSERVFSRITEKYRFIKLFGDDIRIIKKMEE